VNQPGNSHDAEGGFEGGEVIGVRRGLFGVSGTGDTSGYGGLVREIEFPGRSSRPYGGYFDEVVDSLTEALERDDVEFDDAVENVVVFRDELTLYVRRELLSTVARLLRDEPELRFELSLGVSGVHYPRDTSRELHAVYPLR
jgi:NADH-quinone oxidoreductase subunit C